MLRRVNGPTQRRATIIGILCLQRRVESKDESRHFHVSVPRGPVKRRATVLTSGIYRPTSFQHEADRVDVLVLDGVHELATFPRRK